MPCSMEERPYPLSFYFIIFPFFFFPSNARVSPSPLMVVVPFLPNSQVQISTPSDRMTNSIPCASLTQDGFP
ncbi:hypothetical protein BDV26DRAFT_260547 [Aspergillus bertholletiae]|uniref:Uncharacterized protein n=1 Tax=Aspergillus bertholletiae TaxID=1226010 RepID=A0A5N7BAZ2_9EURO|nr:hypothetical protein BDV26DRAFT_260547 [Aspergillus bertholletiae]